MGDGLRNSLFCPTMSKYSFWQMIGARMLFAKSLGEREIGWEVNLR